MRRFLYLTVMCIFFPTKASGVANILDVGLMNQGRPPYYSLPTDTEPTKGLYIDILDEIGRKIGIEFRYLFLPQARIRHLMNHYRLDVEPGIAEEWRIEPAELENSIYSRSILTSSEVVVYNPKRVQKPINRNTFNALTSCSVLGFSKLNLATGKEVKSQDVLTELQIFKLLQNQRCDFAVFPEDVIASKLVNSGLMATDSIHVFSLKLRLTNQHLGLLPSINTAIDNMVKSGVMANIIIKHRGLNE
ncbi:ABC transporter substrate-binding protein [Moritella marina ATCC 15381]|uniref:ABC transporter substrate-binding protein n=1 Tax=Moritella marina ATCC 15381 TaxID=1202962 RepID=A0A5J6WGU0_MORMI|nr:ABC transporter substrate-binding protein [Moritella marina ATCC 15381]